MANGVAPRDAERLRYNALFAPDGKMAACFLSYPKGSTEGYSALIDAEALSRVGDFVDFLGAIKNLPYGLRERIAFAFFGEEPYREFDCDLEGGRHVHVYLQRCPYGTLVGIEDETQVTRIKRIAEQGVGYMGLAMGRITHDIRDPLTTLNGTARLALKRLEGGRPDDAARHIKTVIASSDGLVEQLNHYAGLAKMISREHTPLKHETIDMYEYAIMPAIQHVTPAAARKKITLAFAESLGPEPIIVCGDAYDLMGLYCNLLSNAVKNAKTRVTLGKQVHPDRGAHGEYELNVYNDGDPIPPEKADALFKANGSGGNVFGHGLGLGVCGLVVKNHGGRIWVDTGNRTGADFRFTLPMPPKEEIDKYLAELAKSRSEAAENESGSKTNGSQK